MNNTGEFAATYIRLELSLQDVASLLADGLHSAVLVNLASELTSFPRGGLRDRTGAR